jgi:hypothetical protein
MFTAFQYPESVRSKKVVSSFLGDGNKWVKLQDKSQLIGFVSLKFQTAGVMGFRI